MPRFDIWCEGYNVTGQSSRHECMASNVEAPTFKEACQKHFKGDGYYNAKTNSYWGCRLFDNASDAARSFG